MSDEKTLTLGQLALALRLDIDWLRQRADCGDIPAIRAGSKLLFNKGAVEAAIANLAATSTATTHE